MGTSHRVVRKVSSLPENPARSKGTDPCVSASLRKRERFIDSSQWTSSFGCSKPAAILEAHADGQRSCRFFKASENRPEYVRMVVDTGKLYGFPTVPLGDKFSHPAAQLRTRRKSHLLPRAREAILWQPWHLPSCKYLRLARM